MKILHVTKKYPNALGGDAVVVSNLSKQQKLNGHKVVILTSNCDEIKNGRNIYKFGLKGTPAELDNITAKRLISLIMLFFKSFKVLRTEWPDIIHTHAVDMAFVISFAARFYNIPVVHTFHIVTFYDKNQTGLRRKTELSLARHIHAKVITAPNKYDVKKLKQAGFQQAVLLNNGIDLSYWRSIFPKKKFTMFTFISVGRLEKQKGMEYLIKAAAILRAKTKIKFQVLIIGEGSMKLQLEHLVESLQLEDCVKFLGRKDPAEVRKFYSSSSVAVFPSLYEAAAITLLEAWAMQLPSISTDVGILRDIEYYKQNVILIPMQQIKPLASAMLTLMSDISLQNTIKKAAYRYVKQFDWSNIYEKSRLIYEKVTI